VKKYVIIKEEKAALICSWGARRGVAVEEASIEIKKKYSRAKTS
jgi:hypothetical protein